MSLAKRPKKATNQEKITLLSDSTGTWNYMDIMKYFNFSYGKSNQLIKRIEDEKGELPYYKNKTKRRVKIEDVLGYYGTSREKELTFCYQKKDLQKGAE